MRSIFTPACDASYSRSIMARVLQGVHFEYYPSLLTAFGEFYLMVDEAVEFRYQVEARHQQAVEYGFSLPWNVRKRLCRSFTSTGLQVNNPQSA